jgi:hypothetical protein
MIRDLATFRCARFSLPVAWLAAIGSGCGASHRTEVQEDGGRIGDGGAQDEGPDMPPDAAMGEPEGGPLDMTRVAADLAMGVCGRYAACEPFWLQTAYGQEGACETRLLPFYASILTAQGVLATLDQAEACASAKAALSCEEYLSNTIPPACQIAGSLPTGAACAHDWQCAGPQAHCKLASQASCGVCSTLGQAGESCLNDADCASGLVCGSSSTCETPASSGKTCTSDADCEGMLTCLGSQCTAPEGEGSSCDDSMNYGGEDGCDAAFGRISGLYCIGTCVQAQIAQPGAACSYATPGDPQSKPNVLCANGQICDLGDAGRVGTCPNAVADGQSCVTVVGSPNCLPPAVCSGGTCRLRDGSGCP